MIATLPPKAREALERIQQPRAAGDDVRVTLTSVHLDDEQLERRIRAYMATLPQGLAEGDGRNKIAYQFAAWLTHDMAQPEVEAFAWCAEWNAGNRPPLPERELNKTVRSAVDTGSRSVGSGLSRTGFGHAVRVGVGDPFAHARPCTDTAELFAHAKRVLEPAGSL